MATPDNENSLKKWRDKAFEFAEEQKKTTENLVEEGYKLFFDSIWELKLPKRPHSLYRVSLFEDEEENNIKFVYFNGSDARLGEYKIYFGSIDEWQVGISGLADNSSKNSYGILRSRSVQLIVQPVKILTSRKVYEVKYNFNDLSGEEKPDRDKISRRELIVWEVSGTKIVNGYEVRDSFPSKPQTELDHIRFLNCLADIYVSGFHNLSISPKVIVDPSRLSYS